ncbi:hypothetical protein CapIbe_004574 [Capra ibex]
MRPSAQAPLHPATRATAPQSLRPEPQPYDRPPRQLRGRADRSLGKKRLSSLAPHLLPVAPAPPGSLRAVPAPRAPAGREGLLRLGPRSWAGQFLRNLPLSSSPLWAQKEAKTPLPLHNQTLPISTPSTPGRWGDVSGWENLSEFVDPPRQQSAPTPTPGSNDPQPRAFRKASRLAGGPGGPQPRAKGAERRCRSRGSLPRLHPLCQVPRSHPRCPVKGIRAGQGKARKLWVQGRDWRRRGPWKSTEGERGARGLSGHGAPTGRAPGPFPDAEERCLRHFVFTLVSVDTCSSEAFSDWEEKCFKSSPRICYLFSRL